MATDQSGRTPSPDPRDPHPCPTCGVTLVYDGWDSVHVEGPQKNYGADNCRFVVTGILPDGSKP